MNTEFSKLRLICCVQYQFLFTKVQSVLVPPHFVCSGDGTDIFCLDTKLYALKLDVAYFERTEVRESNDQPCEK